MNTFLSILNSYKEIDAQNSLKRGKLEILQVNVGNLCNQSCAHCHIEASPLGKKIMPRKTVDSIIGFLAINRNLILDITGGAPELNPHFDYFIARARPHTKEIIVRSNLTVFFEAGKKYLFDFFKENKVHLICSLPCYGQKNVDAQRGEGVFQASIRALKRLNTLGYAKGNRLQLDLVYNPVGAYLPPAQNTLERAYKHNLAKDYGIQFNNLITITNAPIKRFKNYLETSGQYEEYLDVLRENFNPQTVSSIMCRTFLSVGCDGELYDCDFNQALGWALKNAKGHSLNIGTLNAQSLVGRDILVGEHCLSCTAGYGSSCQGALAKTQK